MCATVKSDIELLPGELLRQLVCDTQTTPAPDVPVQQSRVVLPDDTDEDQIEQIDIDRPNVDSTSSTGSRKSCSPLIEHVKPESISKHIDQRCSRGVDAVRSIPVEIKSSRRKSGGVEKTQIPFSHSNNNRPPSNNQHYPRRSNYHRQNGFAPCATQQPIRRMKADRIPSLWSIDDSWTQPSYIDYYPPPTLRSRRTYYSPRADYLMANFEPTVIPLIPIIW